MLLKISDTNAFDTAVAKSIEILQRGGIVAYPTETVYGLGVDPENPTAMENLYNLKGRPAEKAVSVMLASTEMLEEYFPDIANDAKTLIAEFMPGALTLILPKPEAYSTFDGDTVGVRVPDHKFCQELIKSFQRPITTTSANISGKLPATEAGEVIDYFGDKIDLVIDGGKSTSRTASTVVDFTENEMRILREGLISTKKIERVLREYV